MHSLYRLSSVALSIDCVLALFPGWISPVRFRNEATGQRIALPPATLTVVTAGARGAGPEFR